MTTFTRIRINPRHRAARHALASNERIHAIVQRATAAGSPDGDQQRTLWRLDPGHTVHALYIVSSGYVNAAVIRGAARRRTLGHRHMQLRSVPRATRHRPAVAVPAQGESDQEHRLASARHPRQTHPDHQTGRTDRMADPSGVTLRVPRSHQPARRARGHHQGFRRRLVHAAGPSGDVAFGHLRRLPRHR